MYYIKMRNGASGLRSTFHEYIEKPVNWADVKIGRMVSMFLWNNDLERYKLEQVGHKPDHSEKFLLKEMPIKQIFGCSVISLLLYQVLVVSQWGFLKLL